MLVEVEEIKPKSFIQSYICSEMLEQIVIDEKFEPLPSLTLDIGDGLTPDISVYLREQIKPNFLRDFPKYTVMPILAVEVISASQNIQDLLDKARKLVSFGIKAVWTIEPFGRTIFVTTKDGEQIFHNQEIESEGIKVDFKKNFNGHSE